MAEETKSRAGAADEPPGGPPAAKAGEKLPGPAGPLSREWLSHAARTAIAAGLSLECARLLRLPEAYWAPISTLVVMQSTLGAAWDVSKKRFLGTALGALTGGLLATYFAPRVVTFAAAVFLLGVICALLRQDQTAYRFAGITLAIVMLVERTSPPYQIAAHRFVEVSLGILVGLALLAAWPEQSGAGRG